MHETTDGQLTSTRQRAQLSRDQILNATAESMREYGYDGTTIRRIAGILNCAVGSIYRYFKNKRELLFAVTQRAFEPVMVLVDADVAFDQVIRVYHKTATADPAAYRLMFWLAAVQEDGKAADEQPTAIELPPIIRQIVDAWSGILNDQTAARRCWALLHGMLADGTDADTCVAVLRAGASHSAVQRDLTARRAAEGETEDAQQPVVDGAAVSRVDDVTLL